MKHRIVFKSPNSGDRNYQWNKYITGRGLHYLFDTYTVGSRNAYKWKKSVALNTEDANYLWDKFEPELTGEGFPAFGQEYRVHPNPAYTYTWNYRNAYPAGTSIYSWDTYTPIWNWDDYEVINKPIYDETQWGLTGKRYNVIWQGFDKQDYIDYYKPTTDGVINDTDVLATFTWTSTRDYTLVQMFKQSASYSPFYGATIVRGANGSINANTGAVTVSGSATSTVVRTYLSTSSNDYAWYNSDDANTVYIKLAKATNTANMGNRYGTVTGIDDSVSRIFAILEDQDTTTSAGSSDCIVLKLTITDKQATGTSTSGNIQYTYTFAASIYNGGNTGPEWMQALYYETAAGSSVIKGYEETIGPAIGPVSSAQRDAYPANGAYDAQDGTRHWAIYTGLSYGEFLTTEVATSPTAHTTTNLAQAYSNTRQNMTLYGPVGQEVLQQPRAYGDMYTITSNNDPSAYPIDGYAYGASQSVFRYYVYQDKTLQTPRYNNGAYDVENMTSTTVTSNTIQTWRVPNADWDTWSTTIRFYNAPYIDEADYKDVTITKDSGNRLVYPDLTDLIEEGYRWYNSNSHTYSEDEPWTQTGGTWYLGPEAAFSGSVSHVVSPSNYYEVNINLGPVSKMAGTISYTWGGWGHYRDNGTTDPYKKYYLGLQPSGSSYVTYVATDFPASQTYGAGEYIETVGSYEEDAYPVLGMQDGYFYQFKDALIDKQVAPGTYIEDVVAYVPEAYPYDGVPEDSDAYYYEFIEQYVEYWAEGFIERVMTTVDQYPHDGPYNNRYYKYAGARENNWPQTFVEEVFSDTQSAYPTNGEGEDGYYYIYVGLMPGVIYSITSTEIKDGPNYAQEVNTEKDFQFGVASCASLEVEVLDTEIEAQKYLGLTCEWYTMQHSDTGWRLMGTFVVDNVTHKTEISSMLTMHDNMNKFSKDVESWLNNITYPITLGNLFTSLCNYCGVSYTTPTFMNSDFRVYENAAATGITGRQVMSYIAQVAGGFARCTTTGSVEICQYTSAFTDLDRSKYTTATLAIYSIDKVNKLNIKGTESDVGTTIGTGDNVYEIVANPLLFVDNESQLTTVATNLLMTIQGTQYTPGQVELLEDYGIKAGDIVTVDGKTFYVMQKTINKNKVVLKCVGQKSRDVIKNVVNAELIALRGKTNELTRTLDATISTLTDNTNQLRSEIKQTADSITATIEKDEKTVTQIRQDLDGIQLTYNAATGTASLRIGDIEVDQLVDNTYVTKAIAGIELTGYVKFNDLSRSGSTTINGNNITTGIISSDRLNLTGAITWGDLSADAKNRIIEYVDDEVNAQAGIPSYIHSTYIDQTNIYSPNIYGAKITAGQSADGYVQMSGNGMNFVSGRGGNLVGIGYYSGNYAYPYIVFGQGVDATGTDRGMIKKYANGIWIGDSDGITSASVGQGTGIFIRFTDNTIWKYENGVATRL